MTHKQQQADVWEKWAWLWDVIFYVTVVGSAVLARAADEQAVPFWITGLLTAVLLLWHWAGMRLNYRNMTSWDDHAPARLAILVGDILLWLALVTISPVYYLVLFGLFSQIFRHLPIRYAVVAILILTGVIIFDQLTASDASLTLANPGLWAFLSLGLAAILNGIWVSAIAGQSTQRQQLITQLEETRAELAAAEHREGVLEERQRLAREIHDTLAQGFTSIVMQLEAAEQALPNDMDMLQEHLDRARSTARISLDQARLVIQDLRPDLLEQRSLPDALDRVAARWREETGIPLTTQTTGSPVPLPLNIEVTMLRATQEALANVRKHAQATAVQLTLSYMGDVVILDVQDNGAGIGGAESSGLSSGYGLQAMRERVAQCGGAVELESEPGVGTTIVVTIPLAGKNVAVADLGQSTGLISSGASL